MSKSGTGRGRGWLKLEKSSDPPCPGLDEVNKKYPLQQPNPNPPDDSDFSDLIKQFDIFKISDDGIQLNNKIRYICEYWEKIDDVNFSKSIEAVYNACIFNDNLAEKLILVWTFKTESKRFRSASLKLLQDEFENAEFVRKNNEELFFKNVRFLSKFWKNIDAAKVENDSMKGYLEILLKFGSSKDIQLILSVICNHAEVFSKIEKRSENQFDVATALKLLLVDGKDLTRTDKLMLLLSIELIETQYKISPKSLEFYKKHIEQDKLKEILPSLEKMNATYQKAGADLNINSDNCKINSDISNASNGKKNGGRPILGVGARTKKH